MFRLCVRVPRPYASSGHARSIIDLIHCSPSGVIQVKSGIYKENGNSFVPFVVSALVLFHFHLLPSLRHKWLNFSTFLLFLCLRYSNSFCKSFIIVFTNRELLSQVSELQYSALTSKYMYLLGHNVLFVKVGILTAVCETILVIVNITNHIILKKV